MVGIVPRSVFTGATRTRRTSPRCPGFPAARRTETRTARPSANVQIAIEEWIDTARDLGRAIPQPRERHGRETVLHDGRIERLSVRDPREMRGFLTGTDTAIENDPERV